MEQEDGSKQTIAGQGPQNYRTYKFTVTGTYVYIDVVFSGNQYFRIDFSDGSNTGTKCTNAYNAQLGADGLSPGSTASLLIYPVNSC